MKKNIVLNDLTDQQDMKRLKDYLRDAYDTLDVLYTDTAPNGSIAARRNKLALYYDGADYTVWVNTDGSTTWLQIGPAEDPVIPDAFPSGGIIMWSGAISAIPTGWVLCDGTNGTPNLTDRFVIHADADSGGTRNVGDTGGAHTKDLSHTHSGGYHTHDLPISAFYQQSDGESSTWPASDIDNNQNTGSNNHSGTNKEWGGNSNGVNTPTSWLKTYSGGTETTGLGGSATQDIIPKYYALAFIMKT